ncbi:MAG: phosphoribosyl-AMP cyclohydrolase [Halodesulfurarchaeum sp.]
MDAIEVDLEFEDGLIPVVAQDAETDAVLMFAYATREAVERTVETGRAHYYSRSREELWEKGETSGHTQSVEEIRVDCDADTLLYRVEQTGGACHTGHRSCFYRTLDGTDVGEVVFDPEDVY